MKTLRILALLFVSAFVINGCTAELPPEESEYQQGGQIEMSFSASFDEQTKTAFADLYGTTMWTTGDRIQILGQTTSTSAVASNLNSDKTHATFKATVTDGEQLYAIYPSTPGGSLTSDIVRVTVPSSQDGKFATANIAVAKADGANFYFRNVATVFQFVVDMVKYPTAAKVRVEPINSSEKLNGPISVDLSTSNPTVTPIGGGTLSIVADLSTSQGTGSKTAYIAVLPKIYHGVKFVILEDNNTILRTVTYSGLLGCEPNQMYKFGDLSQHLDPYSFLDTETFSNCNGTGGRDGSLVRPSTALTSANGKCDYSDWVLSGVYEAKQSIAVSGDGTNKGFAITPELGISTGWATLSFDIAATSTSASLRHMLFIEGKGKIQKQVITMPNRNWHNVTVYIQGADASTKVRFETYNANSGFFLDNVSVIDGAPAFNYLNLASYEIYLEAEDTYYTIPGGTNVTIAAGANGLSAFMSRENGLALSNIPINNTPNEKVYTVYLVSNAADKVNDGNNSVIVHQRGMAKVFTIPESLSFTPAGGSLTAQLNYWNLSPVEYVVTCSNSHFTVARDGDQLTVTAPANTTDEPITGTVTISVYDQNYARLCTLPLTQAAEPVLAVTPESQEFVYTGGEFTASVVTKNFASEPTVTASSSNSAFVATVSGGNLVVTVPENTTSEAISSTITVTATDGTATKTAEVVLSVAGMPELTVSSETFELESAAGSKKELSYTAKNFGTGTPSIATSLAQGQNFAAARSGNKITVTAQSDNTTGEVYKDTLIVTASLNGISREVRVPFTQKFAVAEPADQTIAFSAATATAYYGTPLTGMTVTGAQTTVTYSISFPAGQPACATIDAATGEVTPLAVNGTATVTATAAGTADYKTATASYTLTVKRLPAAYTETEYVQSNADKYIDAGLTLNGSSRVVIDFAFTVSTNGGYLYGALHTNSYSGNNYIGANQFALNSASDSYIKYGAPRIKLPALGTSRHVIDHNANNVTLDGTSLSGLDAQQFTTPSNMYLFWTSQPADGTTSMIKAKAKIYSCQVYQDGTTLSRDFVPCTSGTTAGMYDLANGVFYPLQ